MRYYARKTTKSKKSTRKYVRKPSKAVKTIVKNEIKRSIKRNIETKHTGNDPATYVWASQNNVMSDPVTLSDAFDLYSGSEDGERVGNIINVTKAILNVNIVANVGATYPVIMTIFIGYLKRNRGTAPTAGQLASIFQDGGGTTDYNGSTLNLLRNVNRELFTIAGRYDIKVSEARVNQGTNWSNNDFPLFVNKKINLKSMLGKTIYTADTATGHNKELFMWCSYCGVGSTTNIYSNVSAPIFNYYVEGEYTDQ